MTEKSPPVATTLGPEHVRLGVELKNGILIVEDESVVAKDIAGSLERLGYPVVGRASSGAEAIRKVDELKPDLVLMDIHLRGEMDGITAARTIRERFSVAIIYLTAFSDDTTMQRAVETDPLAYLAKPFREPDLRAAIEVALRRHALELARREREEEFRSMSLIDEATGLHNRRGFSVLAGHKMKIAQRDNRLVVIFFIDLDDLKRINDKFGHAVGDNAIRDSAQVLRQTFIRQSDVVARFAGDEFVVFTLGDSFRDAERMLIKLRDNLKLFNSESHEPFMLEMSVGYAIHEPSNNDSLESLLARADESMYRDKRNRKNS